MTEKQVSIELLILSQKEDENLYIYYHWTKTQLIKISEKNQKTYNRQNLIVLNNAKQYIPQNTIAKFGFYLKISDLHLSIINYRVNLMCNFYRVFKKTKIYLNVLKYQSLDAKKI